MRVKMRVNLRGMVRSYLCIGVIVAVGAVFGAPQVLAQASAAPSSVKKQLTLERLFSGPYLGGDTTEGIEWTPDGKRISYLERKATGGEPASELWTMDRATGERKVSGERRNAESRDAAGKSEHHARNRTRSRAGRRLPMVSHQRSATVFGKRKYCSARFENDDVESSRHWR